MKIALAAIARRDRTGNFETLSAPYLERLQAYTPVEARGYRSEAALLEYVEKLRGRMPALLVLLDGRGRMLSSEEFAGWMGRQRDSGLQQLIFVVGPADGWSDSARGKAGMLLSLGPMTLPHELARVVLAEQVYRAFTILAGHPYHRE